MSKKSKTDYSSMSKEAVIERCEMYRRQIGGMSKRPNIQKQEINKLVKQNKDLRKLISNLFTTYVESHTWVNPDGSKMLSHYEFEYIQRFKKILEELDIDISCEVPDIDEIDFI